MTRSKDSPRYKRGTRLRQQEYHQEHLHSLDRVKKNLLYHFMQKFFAEETVAELADKSKFASKAPNLGFSGFLNNIGGRKGNYDGYTRIESEENAGGQVVLDPHAPLKWATHQHFVQKPTRYDALESLARDSEDEIFEKSISSGKLKEITLNSSCSSSNSSNPELNNETQEKQSMKKSSKNEDVSMKFLGIFLAAVSGLFFTLCSVMVKLLHRFDPSEVLVFRAVIQLILTFPIVLLSGNNPFGPKGLRIMVYLQGLIGCLTVTCIFIGFARLPVGDAATIIFCSPIFVMVFSHLLLREHCGFFRVVVITMLFMGVVLIAKPPFINKIVFGDQDNTIGQDQGHDYDLIGYGAALGGTILTASNFVCMRKLKDVHFSVLIFAFSIMSAVLSAGVVPLVSSYIWPETLEEWTYSILVGVFGLLGQSLLAMALRYETAGVVSVTRSMDIAVAYVIQIVWFGDIPKWPSILGAFVVVLAVFTMAMETAFLHLLKITCGGSGLC